MLALDIAKSCGIAAYHNGKVFVSVVIGDPIYQALKILALIERGVKPTIIAEDLFKFRNPKTTRSLLRRAGGIEAILLLESHKIEYVHHGPARRYIGAKSKLEVEARMSGLAGFKLKPDEADASVLLVSHLKLPMHRPIKFQRINLENLTCSLSWKAQTELEKRR